MSKTPSTAIAGACGCSHGLCDHTPISWQMNTFGVTDGSVSPSATASSSGPRQQQRPLAI